MSNNDVTWYIALCSFLMVILVVLGFALVNDKMDDIQTLLENCTGSG